MDKKEVFIRLTVKQLIKVSVYLGHSKKLSCFLAGWFFYAWRSNMFIINLIKTLLYLKLGLKMASIVVKNRKSFWFVTMNEFYSPHLIRFACICGEPFNVYEWIGGTLSNYKMILGWLSILLFILSKNKYKLRNMDKRNLVLLVGHMNKQIYNKVNVKRFNISLGRFYNRWKKSYNGRKFLKDFKKPFYEKQLNSAVWNEFNDFRLKYLRDRMMKIYFDKSRKKDEKDPLEYRTKFRLQRILYSKLFMFMAFIHFKKKYDVNSINLKNLKSYWYKVYRKKLNFEEFSILRNEFANKIYKFKKIFKELNSVKQLMEKSKFYYKYKYIYNFLKIRYKLMSNNYNKKNIIFNSFFLKEKFNDKFLKISLLKGERRISAKIKKLKKNASFNRAFKLNRWISPFDPLTKTRKPGGGFVPTYLDNIRIIDEFAVSKTPFITLVDSNIVSTDVAIPLPSNDDSVICINFFSYLITKSIFIGKYSYLSKWKYNLIKNVNNDYKKKYIYFFNLKKKIYETKKQRDADRKNFDNRLKFFIDDLVNENLEKFNIVNEIKYNLAIKFDLYYSLNLNDPYLNVDHFLKTNLFQV